MVDRQSAKITHRFAGHPLGAHDYPDDSDQFNIFRKSHLIVSNATSDKPGVFAWSILPKVGQCVWQHSAPRIDDKNKLTTFYTPRQETVRFVVIETNDRIRVLESLTGSCRWERLRPPRPAKNVNFSVVNMSDSLSASDLAVLVESRNQLGVRSFDTSTGLPVSMLVYPGRDQFEGYVEGVPYARLFGHHMRVGAIHLMSHTTRIFDMSKTGSHHRHVRELNHLYGMIHPTFDVALHHEHGKKTQLLFADRATLEPRGQTDVGEVSMGVTNNFTDLSNYYLWLGDTRARSMKRYSYTDTRLAEYPGELLAIDRRTYELKWRKKLEQFADITPSYPDLPLRVHVTLNWYGDVYFENPGSDEYQKYDLQILSEVDGSVVFEKKKALKHIPAITYVDPQKKEIHLLCPQEEVTIRMVSTKAPEQGPGDSGQEK